MAALGPTQRLVLRALAMTRRYSDRLPAGDIEDCIIAELRTNTSVAAVEKALRRLEGRGLVERLAGSGIRAALWSLTNEGRKVLEDPDA